VPTYEGDPALRFLCRLIMSIQAALRRRAAVSAGLWTGAAVLASLSALLAVDAAARFPGAARGIIYAAAWLAGVGIVAMVTAGRWLRRPSPLYVARLIELQRPELKNALITFLELHSDPLADASMRAAVGRRAARILADAEPGKFLPLAALRRPAVAAAGAALVLAAGLWLAQGILFAPWVAAAEASLTTSVAGRPVVSAERQPTSQSGEPRPALSGSEEKTEDAPIAGGMPAPPLPGHATQVAESCPRHERRGDAAQANEHQGKGAAAAQDLAAALQADAEKFDRLAAALDADADNSWADAAGRQGPAPDGAAASPQAGSGADQSGGRGARRQSEHGRPGAAKSEPAAGAAGGARTADGAAGPRPGDTGTAAPLASRGAGGRPESRGAENNLSCLGESGGADSDLPHRSGRGTGGSPTASSSAGRGPAAEPPLARHKPSEEFPPEVLDFMGRAERLIKRADERLRNGEVSGTLLREAGMNHEELRGFVTSWQRKFETAPHGPDAVPVSASPAAAGPTHGEVLHAAQAPCVSPAGRVTLRADGAKGLVQGHEAGVSPRLRPAVAAYFESVGRMAGELGRKDGLP